MRRIIILFVLAAVSGLVAAGAALWLLQHNREGSQFLVLYGNVDIREIQAAFNDNGPVARMLVQEGDRVRKGQLIAEIDDTRYKAAFEQAEGQMRNQQQVLARMLAGSRPEEIAQTKATMDALAVTYRNNEVNYRRAEALARTGAGTIRARDDARAAFDSTKQQYEAARQAYILAVKGPRQEDIAAQRAAYEAAQGTVALDKRELADTRLYAPADGIVEDRILEPGDMASPSTPVFTIALTNPLWVRAYVPERELGKVALGMRATVSTDSFPGRKYRGWVGYLSPAAEFTPKTVESPELRTRLVYQLRVYVCNLGDELRLGMPATVSIDLSQPPAGKEDAASVCGAGNAGGK
ncbi:MAG TPA: efflux RND transporter periplasmic adaptor subunit [Stellaceae bacterium]|nr:efflux RND transporter periplasmic adaptor subunit [Stellaceae bacterium]